MNMHQKYAQLLVNYCLSVKKGDKVYIAAPYIAEPLLKEVAAEIYKAGGIPVFDIEIPGLHDAMYAFGDNDQLSFVNPLKKLAFESFDCYLNVRAPLNSDDDEKDPIDTEKYAIVQKANRPISALYFDRIANGTMRRCLCQFPTKAGAEIARMPYDEYERFVYQACNLYEDDPVAKWLELRKVQQVYVDYLNKVDKIHYKGPNIDITFSVKGRTWINSDGRSNMPSGEVFSAPIEDTVNGKVLFSYPGIYMGKDVEDVELEVKNGEIISWKARKGQDVLDKVFSIDGARFFGEVAVGTNYNIQRITRNILFDEKIGGSIHMAVGQSYKQCGGKNESSVHWDMITDMKIGGEIWADGELIYKDGRFIIN